MDALQGRHTMFAAHTVHIWLVSMSASLWNVSCCEQCQPA